ncbi:fungal-specific transcription factor domain-containing protein [Rhodofomes roseus]|uniref:Fungal-specific transcription factor domain-containing protein n=1 Tax=Rhodofomes roseus TaxID=34475 RepID=A0ABQ8JZ79_9APHY|nr:fungal-specific transcription factor domain-containing protein [Rhodofomes roseus]KAH9829595.1 fungal-specific transcription factor domain-containing protein [Rhodofomes roseus]
MVLHPCFHVGHWVKRVEAMLAWGEGGQTGASPVMTSSTGSMRELAREVFFGPPPGKKAKAPQPRPTLSFFASACAGLALGALVAAKGHPDLPGGPPPSHSRPGSSSSKGKDEPSEAERCSPAALFALSEQAFGLAERTASYDIDSVVTMILQLLYLLHCCPGGTSVQQGVLPLVGKMINVARMMGLANDPDEFPGTYSLFEAETRRRVWWDVFYYDLFVSDCMGHPPLIPDNSFTTHLPADVDEDAFGPSSLVLPGPSEGNDGADQSSAYFSLKCR